MWDYLIAWLISFGLAFSMANTDGPAGLFSRFRDLVQKRFPSGWIYHGIECPICIGFWVSLPVAILMGGSVAMWLSSAGFIAAVMSLSPDSIE